MLKKIKTKYLIDFYIIKMLLGFLLWMPFPRLGEFVGIGSVSYAFLIIVGDCNVITKHLLLLWIVSIIIALPTCYIISLKKKQYLSIVMIMGIETVVETIIIICKFFSANNSDLLIMSIGCSFHLLYFVATAIVYSHSQKLIE